MLGFSFTGTSQVASAAYAGPAPGYSELTPVNARCPPCSRRGLTNAQIVDRLVVGDAAVETHVARVFSKLDLHEPRPGHVVLAYESGIVRPGLRGTTHLGENPGFRRAGEGRRGIR